MNFVPLQDMYARKKEVSAQVSTQVRTSGLSFIAVSWALLTAHEDTLKQLSMKVNRYADLSLALIGFLILGCDLLQYVMTVNFTDAAIQAAQKANPQEGLYDSDSRAYKANGIFYRLKFRLLILGSVLLVGIFLTMFFRPI